MNRRELLKGAAFGTAALAMPAGLLTARPKVTRYAEVLKHNKRVRTRFQDLKHGDVFQLFEQDGTPVDDEITVALSDAYLKDFGPEHGKQWTVNTQEWVKLIQEAFKPQGPRHSWVFACTDMDGNLQLFTHHDVTYDQAGFDAVPRAAVYKPAGSLLPTSLVGHYDTGQWAPVYQNGLVIFRYVDPGVYI